MVKRAVDIIFSLLLIAIFLPLIFIIFVLIITTSKGNGFYLQERVGRGNKEFRIIKVRTMTVDAEKEGLLTIGFNDPRITKTGSIIRKFKLDELPQIFNVLVGKMSMVGPRPEVRKYVDQYSDIQMKVLDIRPGITDYASIEFANESEILKKYDDPEKGYLEEIMPQKLALNLQYIENQSLLKDLGIIFLTLWRIIRL